MPYDDSLIILAIIAGSCLALMISSIAYDIGHSAGYRSVMDKLARAADGDIR